MARTRLLFAAGLVSLIAAAPALSARSTTITIVHAMRGCHVWWVGTAKAPTLKLTLKPGTTLRIVNSDIMPHKLIQQNGPKLALVHANMNHPSASMTVKLTKKGTYRFTTRAGEDYPIFAGHKTIGEDYVLHLTVLVK